MSTPYERLMAEGIPTRPPPAQLGPRRVPAGHQWTPAEQAQHWADLCEAIADWRWDEDPRHLRLIRQTDAA
ncbi:hypothetical protein QBB33_34890 [Streptomyces scabiei]|uniref:hypothetical protein n=1 Tax=Streptomyces scabiei TaxID=1930 RepID=UPI001FF6559E|nr:hypothetical protein [Streptomyces sp. LBUM 1485]